MALARNEHGGGDRPPLLIAHGLYGSARNWGVIAKRLSEDRPVVTVDMRNHGSSPWFDTHSYEDLAADLEDEMGAGGDLLGHSMGGKAAMVLALRRPHLVRKLIVADIAPVRYRHSQLPMIEAMESLDLEQVTSRGDADSLLQNLVEDRGVRSFLLQSLDVANRRWRLNLGVLREEMDRIMGFPETGGSFDGPALFLTGGASEYVTGEHREIIKSLFKNAYFAKIPNAGHWLHAERPREFAAAVDAFLSA